MNDTQEQKKPYAAPDLTIHGDIDEITQYPGGADRDGYGGSIIGQGERMD